MKHALLICLCLTLAACASQTLISPGINKVGDLSIETTISWTKLAVYKPGPKVEVWTVDGQALDSIMFFKGVADQTPLFRSKSKTDPMPNFKAEMLPQEVTELLQSSLTKFYGEGNILLTIEGLKPTQFLSSVGFRFDMRFTNQKGLNYLGAGAATVKNNLLYMVIYTGTQIHYFNRYAEEFEQIIASASI